MRRSPRGFCGPAVRLPHRRATRRYLGFPWTKLATDRQAVENARVLYRVFKDLMDEPGTTAFTIRGCMGTIIPMSETTACLPLEILTHYESDYGAAPKVTMPVGQRVSFIDPEYSSTRWVGFQGIVRGNPFYPIWRSQQDVEILGDWRRLRGEARDSHRMMVYGDFLREIGFAARKLGLEWDELSART